MKRSYQYLLRRFLLSLGVGLISAQAYGQATVLGTDLVNGSYSTYNLTDLGVFRQIRLQASSGASASTRKWEFATGTAASTNYSTNWRPYTGPVSIAGYNTFIAPNTAFPATTATATFNTSSGGTGGFFPAVVSGRYYTINITENSTAGSPANESMSVIETGFNPVAISAVNSSSGGGVLPGNSVLVSATLSATPANSENLYIRYSTNAGFTSSSIVQMSVSGSTASGFIPCLAAGTQVYYYVYSSPKSLSEILADVSTHGQRAHDMATLSLGNNSGANFNYTVSTGTAFTGSYAIPSSCYPTIHSFVTALNSGTITGPVAVYVMRGHRETAPATGINLTTSGTSSNPIRFMAFGTGPKPLVNAGTGTITMSTSSTSVDYIWGIHGSDYVSIDGINLADSNASGAGQMEAGFAVFRNSASDASRYLAIRNCRIWFRNPVLQSGPSLFENGNKGIAVVPVTAAAMTTTITPNAATGRCEFDTIESDTVINAFSGILFRSANETTIPYTFIDQSVLIASNVIIGFAENGIKAYNINNVVVRNNRVDNNNQIGYTGISTTLGIQGIWISGQGTNNANTSVTGNFIAIRNTLSTSSTMYGIRALTDFGGICRLDISNNQITRCFHNGGSFIAIAATPFVRDGLRIVGNRITDSRITGTSGTFTGIQWGNSSGMSERGIVRENIISRDTTAFGFAGINVASSSQYLKGFNVSRNTIGGLNPADGIYFFNNGTISYGILNNQSNPSYEADSNIIANLFIVPGSAGTGTLYGYYDFGSVSNGTRYLRGNQIIGLYGPEPTGSSVFVEALRHGTASSNNCYLNGNVIRRIHGFTSIEGLSTGYGDYMEINDNVLDSFVTCRSSATGTCIGIDHSLSSGDSVFILRNRITRIFSNSTSTISNSIATGLNISVASPTLVHAGDNIISDVGNLSSFGYGRGIALGSSGVYTVWNNRIANISGAANTSTSGSSIVGAAGMEVNVSNTSTTPVRVFNNTIFLNTSGTSTNFSSAALLWTGSLGTVDVFNNIFYNTSTPGSATTAFTAGFLKTTTGITNTNYSDRSNNNLYFLNSNINRKYLVYRNSVDGWADSTMCQFLGRLTASPQRDVNSVQGAVSFLSTSPASSSYLLVDASNATFAEGGGRSITGYGSDVQGQPRNNQTPDIGADEFNGSAPSLSTATLTTTVTHPATTAVNSGTRDAQILRVQLAYSSLSSTAPVQVNRLVFNTSGTTSASTSIDTVKLWYTAGNASFSSPVLLGQLTGVSGAFAFNPNQRIACAGSANFWITYGVRCPGTGTFVLDGQLDSVYTGSSGVAVTGGAPTGSRSITNVTALSGTYTVGGTSPSYANLNAAIGDLNSRGLAGPVIFDVRSGHVERAPAGGIVININPTTCGATRSTRINTLTIRRASSTGAAPIISAGTGTNTPGGVTPDGILKIVGDDYITIDGLAFRDTSLNTTATTQAEWGIALLKRNAADGCKRIVIRNCSVVLNRANNGSGGIRAGNGSVGIVATNLLINSTTAPVVTLASGTHDSIRITNNVITSCYQPIHWFGPELSAGFYFRKDMHDTISNNRLTNFGGSTVETNGIQMLNTDRYVITDNFISNKANSGVDHTATGGTFYGIRIGLGTSNTFTSNTINNQSQASGIISRNVITWNHVPASSTNFLHGGIAVYAGGVQSDITIENNRIVDCNFGANSLGTFYGVYLPAWHRNAIVRRNSVRNIAFNGIKTFYGFAHAAYGRYRDFTEDTVFNITNIGAAGSTAYGIFHNNTSTSPPLYDSVALMNGNLIGKFVFSPTSPAGYNTFALFGQYQNFVNVSMNNNTVQELRGNDFPYGIYALNGNIVELKGNVVDSITTNSTYSSPQVFGIFNSASDSAIMLDNRVTRLYANGTSGSTMYGLLTQSGRFAYISGNKVANLTATGSSTTTVEGLRSNNAFESFVINNYVGDVKAPAMNSTGTWLTGIQLLGAGLHQVYHNTVYLNAGSTGSNFSSTALQMNTATARHIIANNILYNTSTPSGSGFTAAMVKLGTGLLPANYFNASGNNLYYAGTPGSNRVIYRNATDQTSDQTICDFLNRSVNQSGATRDAYSLSSTLTFTSMDPMSSNYLHINTSTGTSVESAGQALSLVTDDYNKDTRSSTAPDIGADEGGFTPLTPSISISDTLVQIADGVSEGARNAIILRLDVALSGAVIPPNLTRLRFSTLGTTSAAANLDSARVFFTGTNPVFSTNATRFGNTIAAPSGNMTFNGNLPLYCNDTFYFWLAYDLKCGSAGDSVDARGIDMVIGGTTYNISPSNPAGKRRIASPMSGTFTVGGSSPNYSTLAAAISDISLRGLNGAVTLNVRAGHTEVAPTGGIQLYINSACPGYRPSRTRPLIIQKSGAGNNPIIYGYQGTSTNTSSTPDAIFRIVGEDWVTIDGIDLQDSSTARNPVTLMEWGYALVNSGPTDGCKRVVIKNASIRMSLRHRESAGSQVGGGGSKGILVSNILPTDITALPVTSTSGSHDSCRFDSLRISRVNTGIHIIGFNDVAPFRFLNQRDSVTNCRITAWGDSAVVTTQQLSANGIRSSETNHFYCANNFVDNRADGGYGNHVQTIGIAVFAANTNNNQNVLIENNTVSLGQDGRSSSIVSGIYSAAGGNANRVIIRNNKVWRSACYGTTPGIFYGIRTDNRPSYLLVENDTLLFDTTRSTAHYGIYTASAGSANINNNLVQGVVQYAPNGTAYMFFHAGTSDTLRMQNNIITGDSSRGSLYGIYSTTAQHAFINNNRMNNCIAGIGQTVTSTTLYGIFMPYNGTTVNLRNNSFENLRSNMANQVIYAPGASVVGRIAGNTASRIFGGGSASVGANWFIYAPNSANNEYYIDSNTVDRDTALNGYFYGIYATAGANRMRISDNTISNVLVNQNSSNAHYLIFTQGTSLNTEISRNQLINDSLQSTSTKYSIYSGVSYPAGSVFVNDNILRNLRYGGGTLYHIFITGSGRFQHIRNNVIENTRNNALTGLIYCNSTGQRYRYILNNRMENNLLTGATSNTMYGLYLTNTSSGDTLNIVRSNTVRFMGSQNAGSSIYGVYNFGSGGTPLTEYYSSNTFDRVGHLLPGTGGGVVYGMYLANGASSSPRRFVDSNVVRRILGSGTGGVYGIFSNYNLNSDVSIRNNRVDSLLNFGGLISGIEVGSNCSRPHFINRNIVADLISYGSSGSPTINGIRLLATGVGSRNFINNNLVDGLQVLQNSASVVRGISIETGNTADTNFIEHNTVFLNANTSGPNLTTAGIFTSTTPRVILRNNLVVNTSVPKGTGYAAAYDRSSSALTTYLGASNGNSFFAGTPGAANLIYRDGINNILTIAAFRTLVGPNRDSLSVTTNAVFQATSPLNDSFLKVVINDPANCALNKGGLPTPRVSADYWNRARNSTRPDIGAHEFTPMPAIAGQPRDTSVCPGSNVTFTALARGASILNYRWFKNGIALSNGGSISGADRDTLRITGVAATDSGLYTVRTWICAGDSVLSNAARLRVGSNSIAATSIRITPLDTVCPGTLVSLKVVGGSLGTGASWKWFTTSCGGTAAGTGDSIAVRPLSQTIYFVRAEGTCNTTTCASDTVFMRDSSFAASSIVASVDSVCIGSSVTLSVIGGSLGYQADWKWYSSSCGGAAVGSGSSINVTPSATTTYFVRAEGSCNNTACVSKSIKVNTFSTAPTSITASADSVCIGSSVTLSVNGGSLGSNADWKWYSSSCGGTAVGSGSSISVTPSATTTYFVRAEGTCDTTACTSKSIKVNTLSTAPSSITASTDSVCNGSSVTLSVNGGSLGSNASWKWYSSSCGGTAVGSGSSISVTPSATTTYFVRAEGTCNNTACASKSIQVNTFSTAPTSITASADSVCNGSSVTLSVNGGSLGSNADWKWYSSSCGGTAVGSGSSISVTPSATTTYFVRAEGTCNTSACASKSIQVNTQSTAVSSVIASADSVCPGNSSRLRISGGSLGSNASWKWYTTSCGGTAIGTGDSLLVTPTSTTTYFVRAEGTCNTSSCGSISVRLMRLSSVPSGITASSDSVCRAGSTTLGVTGGTLGSGANWQWYTGSCGGTSAGTGISLSVNPTLNTTYFARAEGICNNTACESKRIIIRDSSIALTGLSATLDTVLPGQTTTLKVVGGQLGNRAVWRWYKGGCGFGTAIGSGDSITVTLSSQTTFYVRAEGLCNNTTCVSRTIFLRDSSRAPTGIIAGLDSICQGTNTTLTPNGGNLGFKASWVWYTGSCGGTQVGTGTVLRVNPSVTTTYWVRAEGPTNTTACASFTLHVRDTSLAVTSIRASLDSVCSGSSSTLRLNGGKLGYRSSWKWYNSSCGGTLAGTGDSLQVSPGSSTTYFVRAEGFCNTTKCESKFIKVNTLSASATSITASTDSVCSGGSSTLRVNGGTLGGNAGWKWYSNSCGGTAIGSGSSIVVNPTTTTTYFVRAEGTCNTTACTSKTIFMQTLSVAPTSVTAALDSLCSGNSVTVRVNGGSLGFAAAWNWFTDSCGGSSIGTGASLTVTPTRSTRYFVRASGACNTTSCESKFIKVNVNSTAPTSITSSVDSLCSGSSVTLSVNGGSLGGNAFWRWYSGSCGGTLVGTGTSISVSPTSNTTYFVRAEGTCNTTSCVSKFIKVNRASTAPTSISASADSVCAGVSVTYTVQGGTLGSNASWRWYSGNCGGTSIGSGTSLTVTPTTSTTYFVRAEGTCNTTACVSKALKLNTFSTAPSGITASADSVCAGTSVTFTASGGSLGSNASWKWYRSSCSGTVISTGNSLTVTPSASETYFVRIEGTCNNTTCIGRPVKINTFSGAPTGITSNADSVCIGSSVTLRLSGGSLGSNASIRWYAGSCGGTPAGSGSSITLTPLSTTTYFARIEGTCNTTICVSKTIKVNSFSVPAVSIISTADSICLGSSVTLRVNGGSLGSNASWRWYENNCGGTSIGSGTSITVSPSATAIYYVRAEGSCNTTVCVGKSIKVNSFSTAPLSISSRDDSICLGTSLSLEVVGGSLGSNASWRWYTGSCGGSSIGSGKTITISPSATTTYFVRAEGTCNSTACSIKSIKVNTFSTAATSILTSADSTCGTTTVTLAVNGGSLGSNASWVWYRGTSRIGTGSSIVVTPVLGNSTYSLRAEGTCNVTGMVSRSIKVNIPSVAATSIISNSDSTCGNSQVTLQITTGTLGSNASWKWYSGSCGGTLVGTGPTLFITPTATTQYFVRAEGTCNTTACVGKTIKVNTPSVAPVSIVSTADSTCGSSFVTLTVNGGSLGSFARWRWYTGNCGSGLIGTGTSITVNPSITTSYFVRAEGLCNATACVSKTIKVNTVSSNPLSIIASHDSICPGGGPVNLSVNGGKLGSNANWIWYANGCGSGTPVGTGNAIAVNPTSTTTYFVQAAGTCNTTPCVSRVLKVQLLSQSATNITASEDSICKGTSVTLRVNGGFAASNARWVWYEGGCGAGRAIGTGTVITVTPAANTSYFVRAESNCNTTLCVSKAIVIRSESTVPVFITSTADTTCGAPITLQVNGGSLGSGGRWAWYTGNCGGTLVGIGNSLTTTPVGPTTYFVRAEGLCNTTQCVRKTIYSATASTAPVAIVASNDTPCLGQQITLTVQGGNLGIGAEWKWYHSSCGGSLIGTGGSLKDIPNGNTTYYVRAEGACNITNCVSRPIRILFPGKPAIGITASADTVLNGANVRLQIIGGSGGSNGRWVWYENGCGNGAPVGFGPTLNVAPGSTTTYYVRQEGTCDSTVCVFKKVSVWGMNVQDQQQLGDLIRLYPNPTKDKLNLMIDVQGNEPTLVKVLDAQGRAIREFSLEAGIRSHVIDVQELSEGQYMLDIRNGRSSAVKRFVKLN